MGAVCIFPGITRRWLWLSLLFFCATPAFAADFTFRIEGGAAFLSDAYSESVTKSGLNEVRGARLMRNFRKSDRADSAAPEAFYSVSMTYRLSGSWSLRLGYVPPVKVSGTRREVRDYSDGTRSNDKFAVDKIFHSGSVQLLHQWQMPGQWSGYAGAGVSHSVTWFGREGRPYCTVQFVDNIFVNSLCGKGKSLSHEDTRHTSPIVSGGFLYGPRTGWHLVSTASLRQFEQGVAAYLSVGVGFGL